MTGSPTGRLDRPERRLVQDPAQILGALPPVPAGAALELACGTGFFTLPLAERLGGETLLIALDPEQEMLDALKEKLLAGRHPRVRPLRGGGERLPLKEGSLALVLAAHLMHHHGRHSALIAEALRALGPGGLLAVVDWEKEKSPEALQHGPDYERRVASARVAGLLRKAGFGSVSRLRPHPFIYLVSGVKHRESSL